MCRKNQLRGWCAVCFGLGLFTGYALDSWLLCCFGGMAVILAGLVLVSKRS